MSGCCLAPLSARMAPTCMPVFARRVQLPLPSATHNAGWSRGPNNNKACWCQTGDNGPSCLPFFLKASPSFCDLTISKSHQMRGYFFLRPRCPELYLHQTTPSVRFDCGVLCIFFWPSPCPSVAQGPGREAPGRRR